MLQAQLFVISTEARSRNRMKLVPVLRVVYILLFQCYASMFFKTSTTDVIFEFPFGYHILFHYYFRLWLHSQHAHLESDIWTIGRSGIQEENQRKRVRLQIRLIAIQNRISINIVIYHLCEWLLCVHFTLAVLHSSWIQLCRLASLEKTRIEQLWEKDLSALSDQYNFDQWFQQIHK